MYIHICIYVYIYTYIYIYKYMFIQTHIYIHLCTYLCVYTHSKNENCFPVQPKKQKYICDSNSETGTILMCEWRHTCSKSCVYFPFLVTSKSNHRRVTTKNTIELCKNNLVCFLCFFQRGKRLLQFDNVI